MMRHDSEPVISSLMDYGDSDEEESDPKNISKDELTEQTDQPSSSPAISPTYSPVQPAMPEDEGGSSPARLPFSESPPRVQNPALAVPAPESDESKLEEGRSAQIVSGSPRDGGDGEQEDRKETQVSPAELISDEEAEGEQEEKERKRQHSHHHHHHHHHRLSQDGDEGDRSEKEAADPGLRRAVMEGLNVDSPSSQGSASTKRKTARLVSYGPDDLDESSASDEEGDGEDRDSKSPELSSADASLLSRSVRNMSSEDIRIPPEPSGKCPYALQKKIEDQYENMRRDGRDLNRYIQSKKHFRNPSIYEKLIDFCHIDEKGTNFPPDIFDPHIWGKESFYDELDKAQRKDMERREKEKKERTKIEFLTGTKKPAPSVSQDSGTGPSDEKKRRSKWDAQPAPGVIHVSKVVGGQQSAPGVVNLTASATGTKATVIPAVGALSKKSSGK